MNNNDVEQFLDYYLHPDTQADYAIMLSGPWGCGKMHFIKSYLASRRGGAVHAGSVEPVDYLYASLYGVRSTSGISDQFFAQAHPVLSSKAARLLGTVFARAINARYGADVSLGENKSILEGMVLRLEGRVLVFDDLERCAMPVSEAMGYINSFVEHEGLKAIVIANEKDIPEEQKPDYERKKERAQQPKSINSKSFGPGTPVLRGTIRSFLLRRSQRSSKAALLMPPMSMPI